MTRIQRFLFRSIFLALIVWITRGAHAEGPGFPNLNYDQSEVGSVLSFIDPRRAISAVNMHRGYLFVPLGADHGGGQGRGAFAFYDISDPTNITEVFRSLDHLSVYHDSSSPDYVGNFAELHHLPISSDYILISERRSKSAGMSILDVSNLFDADPETIPRIVSRNTFFNASPSNYDGYSFAIAWLGTKYVIAPTGSAGLKILDTSDFANPRLVVSMSRSQLNGLSLRSAVPIGNLLILTTAAVGGTLHAIIMDISDPENPTILNSFSGPVGYQAFTYGSKLYGGGIPFEEYDFSDPLNIVTRTLNENPALYRPEYGFGKDDYIFIGQYEGLTKWEIENGVATKIAQINSGLNPSDDHAFITPIGNLAAVCSDHANDRKLMLGIHDAAKDVTPPAPNFVSPFDGQNNVNVRSCVGVTFTDFIDQITVNSETFVVREFVSLEPVPGSYSTMQGIVNFAPDSDLKEDMVYEVVLMPDGIADQSGNAIDSEIVVARFSTGGGAWLRVETSQIDPVEKNVAVDFDVVVSNTDGLDLRFAWDFGDGTPLTAYSPDTSATHTYSEPGNYVVTSYTRLLGSEQVIRSSSELVVYNSPVAQKPLNSSTIIFDEPRNRVWAVNPDNNSVSAMDATSLDLVYETAVGESPSTLSIGPDDTLWVTNSGDDSISLIDCNTGATVDTIILPYGSRPYGIIVDRADARAYVSLEQSGEVALIDTLTRSIVERLKVGPWPRAMSLDRERNYLWISRFISPDSSGEVYRINTANFSLESKTTLEHVFEPDGAVNGRGLPNYLGALAISPDGSQLYIPAKKDNIFRGQATDGLPLSFEHTVRSMASRIDLSRHLEDTSQRLDFDNSDFATAAAFPPLGNRVFFTTSGSASVWVADAYGRASPFAFSSGGLAPDGLCFSADGSRLFVKNFMSRTITVFGLTPNADLDASTQFIASVSTVSQESLSAEVLLGKQLFYDTTDPRLAQEGYMSCASCHTAGLHDGRTWDFTDLGEGMRNTISLNGRGVGHGPLHWSANFDEAHDFEAQIRGLSRGLGLMSDESFNKGNRAHPFGMAKAGESEALDALAAYLASLTSAGKSPHRSEGGALTAEAIAGKQIFTQANCMSCHSGDAFTDSASLAVHDVGTLNEQTGKRLGDDLEGLDTPTLRGLWSTAPYLHDGSAETLKDVLTTQNISGLHGDLFMLSEAELDALVAYLEQIDDAELAAPNPTDAQVPTISDPGPQETVYNIPFSLEISAVDPQGASLRYYASGLPEGLALDQNTGVISGVARNLGSYTVRIGVRNNLGFTYSISVPWRVSDGETYRYLQLIALSEVRGRPWASMAEFNALDSDRDRIDRDDWVVSASSYEDESRSPYKAIDGSHSSQWHTPWSGAGEIPHPHTFTVDMGRSQLVSGFVYKGRSGKVENGRIKDYRFLGSKDGAEWDVLAEGAFLNNASDQTVILVAEKVTPTMPVFDQSSYAFTVGENMDAGSSVGIISGSAIGAAGSVSYQIVSGNSQQHFSIDESSGVLAIKASLDFEHTADYGLLVQMVDDLGQAATVTVDVSVLNVIESNEEIVYHTITGEGAAYEGHGNPALIAFDSDPDRDGRSNALEVLEGTNPAVADKASGIRFGVIEIDGVLHATFDIDVSSDVSGALFFQWQNSEDLSEWHSFANEPLLISDNGATHTYRIVDDIAMNESRNRFIRISISQSR